VADTEIICERQGRAGVVTLDRPKALNALTLPMVRSFASALEEWRFDDRVTRIILRSSSPRAFCAGGDIRLMHDLGRRGEHAEQLAFWREEYQLNQCIHRYPKPIVALADGIVMGGGAGVSIHASFRVAGSNVLFAMPEVGIGFFPDIGAAYFLPRLPGRRGAFLAVAGERIGLGDVMAAGLATHHVPSERFAGLADALCGEGEVAAAIERFAEMAPLPSRFADTAWIDDCFAAPSLVEIIGRVEAAAPTLPAAGEIARTMRTKSPTSMAIALRQMQTGPSLDVEETLRMDYRIVSRICRGHDFYEGVRATIIDRDQRPNWQPARIEDLVEADIDRYFSKVADELTFDGAAEAP
jgi:enoyl-CoA hydratase